MLKVDLHTHILPSPERWPDWTARSGYAGWIELAVDPARCGCARMQRTEADGGRAFFREVQSNCWDVTERLRAMDRFGIGVQVLSTVPVMFATWARPEHGLAVARWLNDDLAETCRAHPDRFIALGSLPMQDADLAIKELERCTRDLGMAGAQIGTNVNGANLDDDGVVRVLEAAAGMGACIFVHPWEMLQFGRHATAAEAPRLVDRMPRHWLPWLVGMPAETALAVCSLLMGGVLDRFPLLRICFAHGGGSFPFTLGRIEHGFSARPDLCQTATKTAPSAYLAGHDAAGGMIPARFYVDSLTHDADALRTLIRLFSAKRVALGSDYPFPLGEDPPGSLIESMTDLPDQTRADLFSGAAMHFLFGDRSVGSIRASTRPEISKLAP